jgi:hypothetical protein
MLRTSVDERVSKSILEKISQNRLTPKPTMIKLEKIFSDDSFVVISTEDKQEAVSSQM